MNRLREAAATATGVFMTEEVRAQDTVISVQITSVGSGGVVTPQVSNDGVTWVTTTGNIVGVGGAQTATTLSAAGMYVYMVQARFFRLNCTALTSGTVTTFTCFGDGWTK